MTQSTPNASSWNGFESSDAAQHMPNIGMHMGQFLWPQPGYMPHPGFCYPPPDAMYGTTLEDAPVAPLPTGPGVAHPANSFLGAANPYAPPMHHQGYLHQHQGPGLAMNFVPSPVPRAPGLSVGEKRVAENFGGRDAKRIKTGSSRMKNDPLFKPMLDRYGQPDGRFVCSKDGMVLNPTSYLKHIKTKKHLGYKLEKFRCPVCSKTYTRLDACKRHFHNGECGESAAGGPPPSFSAGPASTSSAFVAPVMVPTMAYPYPYPMPATSMSQNVQITPPEFDITQLCATPTVIDPALCLLQSSETATIAKAAEGDEDDEDPDFWEANEIQDVCEM